MSRRAFVAGVVGVGCAKAVEPARGQVRVPTSAALPWLSLRDHFVATVGPTSGTGPTLGALRVLADATFAPHSRFPIHGHAEVEILSIVLDGELSHHGDQAHGEVLRARSAQLISARDGMRHAEGNHLDRATRMLQIWFVPDSRGGAPAYFRRDFSARGRHRVAGDEGMPLRCAADVWWVDLEAGESTSFTPTGGRRGYVLAMDLALRTSLGDVARGEGVVVERGTLEVRAEERGSVLWIDTV
ncbi:MAG: pirin family protein [Sandaracinus sp.]|nr:pirin family protein [Myxococcales bacterium]MCB9603036.1 pirin family protein [Sandaracinus sp.]MCB9620071.1 pirin family protein [Sandaracinus sp.]MCB9631928.1 pirin family protein [Sandaracinus sp.]